MLAAFVFFVVLLLVFAELLGGGLHLHIQLFGFAQARFLLAAGSGGGVAGFGGGGAGGAGGGQRRLQLRQLLAQALRLDAQALVLLVGLAQQGPGRLEGEGLLVPGHALTHGREGFGLGGKLVQARLPALLLADQLVEAPPPGLGFGQALLLGGGGV